MANSKQITVFGYTYPSIAAVFRAMGMSNRCLGDIENRNGSFEEFLRLKFPNRTDEQIGKYIQSNYITQLIEKTRAPLSQTEYNIDDKSVTDLVLQTIYFALISYTANHAVKNPEAQLVIDDLCSGNFRKKLTELLHCQHE